MPPPEYPGFSFAVLITLSITEQRGRSTFHLFCSGGALAFGIQQRAICVTQGNQPFEPSDFDRDLTIDLTIDSFVKQDVICFQGQWASRKNVIQYVRHVGSGVHSGKLQSVSAMQHQAGIGRLANGAVPI